MDEALNAAPCGFLSFADDGTVVDVNATLLRMLGYERDELTGKHVETILTVGSRIFYQTHLFPLIRLHGAADEIFLTLRPKGGGDVGVLTNAVRHERGGAITNDCVFLRVQERRKYEDELLRAKQAAEQARTVVEAQRRSLEEANARLESQARELEARHQQLQEQAAELEATSAELHTVNEALLARTDELERQRAVAEEANRAKSNFLAVMSHELRTPLNAIAGYVQLIEVGVHGPVTEGQREALERISRSQRHLLRLINEVLNLARTEARQVDYAIEAVPLGEVLATVMPMVEPQLDAKGLECAIDVSPGVVASADRDKLEQILINLLTNALKFTAPGGRVTVDARVPERSQGVVHLRVADTGIGIPPGMLERIFEPFVQVDASRTRTAEGSGLGLAISRDLARGMGGDLRAESEMGKGSTFTVVLKKA